MASLPELQIVPNAPTPTPGKGFVLPVDGSLPLMLLQALGSRKVSYGSANLNWSASQVSDQLTVTHNLGVTPVLVMLTHSGGAGVNMSCVSTTATSFVAQGTYYTGTLSGGTSFYWLAIG